jgi:hypothetical protein
LYAFVCEGDLLHFKDLGAISGSVNVGAQKNMAFDFAPGDVNNCLVEFALGG